MVVYLMEEDVGGAKTLKTDSGEALTARAGAFSIKLSGLRGVTLFAEE